MKSIKPFLRKSTAIALSLIVSGCAIRPLPPDLPSIAQFKIGEGEITPTTAVVRRIRCEARAAIAKITMSYVLADLKELRELSENGKLNSEEIKIVNKLQDEGEFTFEKLILFFDFINLEFESEFQKFADKYEKAFDGQNGFDLGDSLKVLSTFAQSGVGYEFAFDITENNNATMGVLEFAFPRVAIRDQTNLSLGGSYQRQRKNTRSFRIAETIGDIVRNPVLRFQLSYCNENDFKKVAKKNYHYPIYGEINIIDSFSTYASLLIETNLRKDADDKKTIQEGSINQLSSRDLLDEIQFTTQLSGSANPSISLAGSSNLVSGGVNLANTRMDVHSLTLIIQPEGTDDALRKLELNQIRTDGSTLLFPIDDVQ